MTRTLITLLAIILTIPYAVLAKDNQSAKGLSTIYGKDDPICAEALNRLSKSSRYDFIMGSNNWGKKFETVSWSPLVNDIRYIFPNSFFVEIDINNDSVSEIVIRNQSMFRSAIFEYLYIAPKNSFEKIINDIGKIGAKDVFKNSIIYLNQRNIVIFSNNREAVPLSFHIWNYNNINYLLLCEAYFAHEEQYDKEMDVTLPNKFFVSILSKKYFGIDKYGDDYRIIPDLLCEFDWE